MDIEHVYVIVRVVLLVRGLSEAAEQQQSRRAPPAAPGRRPVALPRGTLALALPLEVPPRTLRTGGKIEP